MLSDIDLGWLAGVLDGEGTICFMAYKRTCANGTIALTGPTPRVSIGNTSHALIERAYRLINSLGCHAGIYGPYWAPKSTKYAWRIDLSRKADVLTLMRELRPALTAKQEQAKFMIAWIEKWPDSRGVGVRKPSNIEKEWAMKTLSALNHDGWEPLKPTDHSEASNSGRDGKERLGFDESQNGQSAATGPQKVLGFNDYPVMGVEPSGSKRLAPETGEDIVSPVAKVTAAN